jgi:hypothetical protein
MALGSDWKCRKLPYVQICDHTAQGKRLPKEALCASLKLSAEMR